MRLPKLRLPRRYKIPELVEMQQEMLRGMSELERHVGQEIPPEMVQAAMEIAKSQREILVTWRRRINAARWLWTLYFALLVLQVIIGWGAAAIIYAACLSFAAHQHGRIVGEGPKLLPASLGAIEFVVDDDDANDL